MHERVYGSAVFRKEIISPDKINIPVVSYLFAIADSYHTLFTSICFISFFILHA
jgi:hypothetical protein